MHLGGFSRISQRGGFAPRGCLLKLFSACPSVILHRQLQRSWTVAQILKVTTQICMLNTATLFPQVAAVRLNRIGILCLQNR